MDLIYRGLTVTLLRYLYGHSLWTLFIKAELLRYYGRSLWTLFIAAEVLRHYASTGTL